MLTNFGQYGSEDSQHNASMFDPRPDESEITPPSCIAFEETPNPPLQIRPQFRICNSYLSFLKVKIFARFGKISRICSSFLCGSSLLFHSLSTGVAHLNLGFWLLKRPSLTIIEKYPFLNRNSFTDHLYIYFTTAFHWTGSYFSPKCIIFHPVRSMLSVNFGAISNHLTR